MAHFIKLKNSTYHKATHKSVQVQAACDRSKMRITIITKQIFSTDFK